VRDQRIGSAELVPFATFRFTEKPTGGAEILNGRPERYGTRAE